MDAPLLAIAVPTYNRADHLARLLDRLSDEVAGLEDVVVHVSDNASPDHTSEVIDRVRQRIPHLQVTRHPTNVGPDENFCGLIDQVQARYVWLMGDDDVPLPGAVRLVRSLLLRHQPDTLYATADWVRDTADGPPTTVERTAHAELMTRGALARRVHVYTTFISGWVVRTDLAHLHPSRRFTGSYLVQLGWVLGALEAGDRHIAVREPLLRATMANSGGYSAVHVFGTSFARVTREALGGDRATRRLARAMVRRAAISFLPGLVWSLRSGTTGSFSDQPVTDDLRAEDVGGRVWHAVVTFIATGPATPARLAARSTRVLAISLARLDQLRAQVTRTTERL